MHEPHRENQRHTQESPQYVSNHQQQFAILDLLAEPEEIAEFKRRASVDWRDGNSKTALCSRVINFARSAISTRGIQSRIRFLRVLAG